ncbi:hypothetical protein SNEBB_004940 [Seison nebaliae]|nr:hypothetical protein SNEBB_004940 [Seison nebaliae]
MAFNNQQQQQWPLPQQFNSQPQTQQQKQEAWRRPHVPFQIPNQKLHQTSTNLLDHAFGKNVTTSISSAKGSFYEEMFDGPMELSGAPPPVAEADPYSATANILAQAGYGKIANAYNQMTVEAKTTNNQRHRQQFPGTQPKQW